MTDYIKNILQIKDPNLHFTDVVFENNDGWETQVFIGTVSLKLDRCPHCGFADTFIKNGHSYQTIKYLSINESCPTMLRIGKQRLRCKNCQDSFMAKTNVVDKYCSIAKAVKHKALTMLESNVSQKDVSKFTGVSPSTIGRLLDSDQALLRFNSRTLPTNIAIDEFRGPQGKYCFIIVDNDTSQIYQILPDRLKSSITHYFDRFSLKERKRVKSVSTDLNSYYQGLVRRYFPNAKLVVDRFHIVSMLTRAFNQVRVAVMKQFDPNTREYRALKNSWRLYLLKSTSLNYTKEYYDRHLRQKVTMAEREGIGLDLDPQLAAGYELLQGAMTALEEHDVDQLMDLLFTKWDVPAPFQTVLKTLRKNSEGVYNATVLPYSNGRVEGINRMIKLIQRTAYGFTNFGHFIARIRLHQMGTEAEKRRRQVQAPAAA
ncbi:ISL3 family transposase [Limosilactobacillus fermentum]